VRVLVTGAAGYLGSIMTELLITHGHDVIALDSLAVGHRAAVHEQAAFAQVDLCDREAVRATFATHQPEAVMHFASLALVGESMREPERYFSNNLIGACNLLDAMLAHGCSRMVFSSSCTVYGESAKMPVTEDLPRTALNPYGATKIMIEEMVEWQVRLRGLRAAILRYFNPAGASERFGEAHQPETHLIPVALEVAVGKRASLPIFGSDYPTPDGTCIRDYIHVLDLLDAHLLALGALDTETLLELNIGTGKGASVREVADAVRRVTARDIAVTEAPRRAGDSAEIYADPTRAQQVLGWRATRTLDDMVASAWAWRQRHPQGYEA
jgi:UDP-glucose 4-epimerase